MNNQRPHPLDNLISDNSLFMLEAMVPFVDYQFKKPLVFLIKYREFQSIMQSLNDRSFLSSCGFDCKPQSTEDMLMQMCNFMPGSFGSSMKQMQQMQQMMNMMNVMESTNDVPNMNAKNNNDQNSDSLYNSVISILNNSNKE